MRVPLARSLSALALLTAPAAAHADDWPQWMGPNRDDVWRETGIVDTLPEGGPKKLWAVPAGGGYSGPAVAGGKVYLTDRVLAADAKNPDNPFDTTTGVPGSERVLCLDAKTGKELWNHPYPCEYKVSYPAGPRCTPTVADGKVYALGAMGNLLCLTADTGHVLWQKDFKKDYQAKTPTWGFSGHPLVYKGLLICLVGGANAELVAFDKDTGEEKWKALTPVAPGEAGYGSPVVTEAGGVPQLLMFLPTGLTALNPDTGAAYWSVPLKPNYQMSIMTPRRSGEYVYAGGYGLSVAAKLASDGPTATEAWRGDAKSGGVGPINMTPFVDGDTIYGVDQPGMLRAVDLKTGKRLWFSFEPVTGREEPETFKGAGSGTAFLVKNGDRFFIFNEKGDLIVAKLTPKGYEELSKAHLVEPTGAAFGRKVVWSHPAFADKCVFVRNDKELACFSLAK